MKMRRLLCAVYLQSSWFTSAFTVVVVDKVVDAVDVRRHCVELMS
jgi:hypothetical protein